MSNSGSESRARGAIFIPVAKLWFTFAAFVLNFGLPNILDPDGVGDFGVVNRLVSILNMVMVTATIQAVSKFTSAGEVQAGSIQRSALGVQLRVAGGLSVAYFLLGGVIADVLNDPSLGILLRASAPIPFCYGLYSVFIGTLNGTRSFRAQALFDMGYATMRTAGILGAALLGFGVLGCFVAFSTAALIILIVAFALVSRFSGEEPFPVRPLLAFAMPVVGVVLFSNAMLSTDLFWLKGMTDPDESKFISGCYFAFLNLAIVPYMIIVSVNQIVFPLISQATFSDSRDRAREYIAGSLRVVFLIAVVSEAAIATAAPLLVALIYPSKPEYLEFTRVLGILAGANVFLCLAMVMMAILNGAGLPRLSLVAAVITVAIQSALAWALIPRLGMEGAALASGGAFLAGTAILAWVIGRNYGGALPLGTVLRGAVSLVGFFAVVWALPASGLLVLGEVIAAALAFGLLLVVTGELRKEDWVALRSLI